MNVFICSRAISVKVMLNTGDLEILSLSMIGVVRDSSAVIRRENFKNYKITQILLHQLILKH
jgi:hypothetical protein